MKSSKLLISFFVMFILFIVFTILVKIVDVQAIGPLGSEVGFASINNSFKEFFEYNDLFYKISKYLGYISFLLIGFYAILGLKQLIDRKNIFKVDKEILLLGAFYIIVLFVYFIFEKIIINYRPVLENGNLEASYPSSHTILSLCVCISSIIISKRIFKNKKSVKVFNILSMILMVSIVLTRLLSGVHWLTDIIGGIFISSALCLLFAYLLNFDKKNYD